MTWHHFLSKEDKSAYQEVCLMKDDFDEGLGASTTESSYDVASSSVQRRQVCVLRGSSNKEQV